MKERYYRGAERLSWSFLLSSPLNAGRSGGIGPIPVSTLLIPCVTVVAAVPPGLATAVLLFVRSRRPLDLAAEGLVSSRAGDKRSVER